MFVKYPFTEEQTMLRDLVCEIAEKKVKPLSHQLDEKEEFPSEIIKTLAQSDLLGVAIPEKYNGIGKGMVELCMVIEELSRADGGVATSYAANFLATLPLLTFGNDEQKEKYLPEIARGRKLAAFAVTEPEAGSDITNLKTVARKEKEFYVLNGTKHFITNGGEADIYVVIATVDPTRGRRGQTAFIVEKGMEGFSFGKKESKLGVRSSATRELIFDNCRVPHQNVLGKEGAGFVITMKTFDTSRVGVAAQAVGIARAALELAVSYASQRIQFGQKIISFQGIQWMLSEMATKIEAARSLVYNVARMIDCGEKNVGTASAMAKLFASDIAMEVTTNAIQILGGYGYMKDYPAERFMRDAKITQIYEGTNQIQKNIIAMDLIKRYGK